MAESRYVEITLEEMETFLKRAFGALHPKRGKGKGGEVVFDLSLSDNHSILVRVYSSIYVGSGMGRSKGSDSIKVVMLTDKGKPLMPAGKIVMRTTNWRTAIQDRIETYLEVYEEKIDYWKKRRLERNGDLPSGADKALDEAVLESLPPPTPAEVREMEDAEEREIQQEKENSLPEEPRPIVKTKPSGPAFEGNYRSLPGGGWGLELKNVEGKPGLEGIGKTQGGRRSKVRLLEKVKSGTYGGVPFELWKFEDINPGARRQQGQRWAEESSAPNEQGLWAEDTMVASVVERYLSRSPV